MILASSQSKRSRVETGERGKRERERERGGEGRMAGGPRREEEKEEKKEEEEEEGNIQ